MCSSLRFLKSQESEKLSVSELEPTSFTEYRNWLKPTFYFYPVVDIKKEPINANLSSDFRAQFTFEISIGSKLIQFS